MMKKAMISQPMKGKTPGQIKDERKELVERLENDGYAVVDSVFDFGDITPTNQPLIYLAEAIKTMAFCDTVFFMPGWEDARGCKIEHGIAEKYGVEIEHVS